MTVEVATGISTLNPAYPAVGDPLEEGQAHLSLIKSALQDTFPNLTGPVTASQSDLNYTTGLSTIVSGLTTNAALTSTPNTFANAQTFSAGLSSTSVQRGGYELLPTGCILMWGGTIASIPGGFQICDGTNGTPNLLNLFVIGAGGAFAAGSTGGYAAATVASSTAGLHQHGGATEVAGVHYHGGATAYHQLVAAEMPSHTHDVNDPGHSHGIVLPQGVGVVNGTSSAAAGPISGTYQTNAAGVGIALYSSGGDVAHAHSISADGTHAHVIDLDGAHSHAVSVPTVPPFYALAFIMKMV